VWVFCKHFWVDLEGCGEINVLLAVQSINYSWIEYELQLYRI